MCGMQTRWRVDGGETDKENKVSNTRTQEHKAYPTYGACVRWVMW